MKKTIDAVVNGGGKFAGKACFFKGKKYAVYDWSSDAFDGGASPISAWGFTGAFADGVDAALDGRGKYAGKVYFFKGNKYVRYDWASGNVDTKPKGLDAWGLKGEFLKGIDAALNGTGAYEKYAYFFKGSKYVVYDWDAEALDGGIKSLADWKLPAEMGTGVDAALLGSGPFTGKAYFFKGEKYARYDWAAKKCDAGLAPAQLIAWDIPRDLVPRAPRFAWIEYEHPGDGVMLASGLEAMGWKNIFDELGPAGKPKRVVKNTPGPVIKARVEQVKYGAASALICRPTDDDAADFLGKWVLNPGVAKGELTFKKTPIQADLVCVSGHGASGEVWGAGNGAYAGFPVTEKTGANAAMVTTGNVKYLIIASCYNLSEFNASRWEPILRKVKPIHGILGYERSYAGDDVGAKVMRTFVALLKAKKTIIQAWKEANSSVGPKQPWAALVHAESEKNTLADLAEDSLPVPNRSGALEHFGKAHPAGQVVAAVAKPYTVAYKMANGVVLDAANNGSSNSAVGLVPGQAGSLVLAKASGSFAVGDEITLLFFHYRFDKDGMDLDGLLTFDPALLASPPASTATVSVTKLSKANPNASNGAKFDGVKIKVLSAAPSFELPYKVSASAHKAYAQDGPGGTYGYFPIGLYPPGTTPNLARTGEVDHYTTGAWLR